MLSEVTGDLKPRKGLLQSEGLGTQGNAGASRHCPWVDGVGASVLKGWQMAGLAILLHKEHCYRLKSSKPSANETRWNQGVPLGGP